MLWGHPGNDVTGMMARSEKVAGTCEKVNVSSFPKILMSFVGNFSLISESPSLLKNLGHLIAMIPSQFIIV